MHVNNLYSFYCLYCMQVEKNVLSSRASHQIPQPNQGYTPGTNFTQTHFYNDKKRDWRLVNMTAKRI